MANRFKQHFTTLLEQDIPELPDFSPETETDALASSLDSGTDPAAYNVSPEVQKAMQAKNAMENSMNKQLSDWIQKIDDFTEFLNGTGPESMQSKLKHSVPDTLLDKIHSTETKRISRAALELSALSQLLKGYMATANNAGYRFV